MVPQELALRRSLLPLDANDESLVVVLAEPLSREDEEQLSFALQHRVDFRAAGCAPKLRSSPGPVGTTVGYRPSSVFKRARVACNVARGTAPIFFALRALESMVRN